MSFNIYVVFDYACFSYEYALKLVFGYICHFWDKVSLFLMKTDWQPCCWSLGMKFQDLLLRWLKLTNLFSKAHSVYLYHAIRI